ncbi:MAG TPA: hypothetical protein DCX06_09675, partial [Opitutae bacterium]|nr:hypothetical protein [Opitutae bacterium]
MKFSASTPRCIESSRQGFAVVIALSLMAFVLLLLLSITTLVQVETQGSSIQMDQLEAEQAALLSLNVAIGKLQETAGLDQRVTAPAEAVDGVNGARQVTGVWRSWEGRDHKASGFPIAPDYGSKLSTGDQEIDVGSSGAGRFLSWLVSTAYDDSITPVGSLSANSPPNINEVAGRTVPLLGKASVGVDDAAYARENEVHLEPTTLADGSLSYAWWVSGENTKSLLRDSPAATGVLDWTERLSSSTRPEVNVFDISNPSDLDKASTRTNLNLVSNRAANALSVAQEYFHDLTTYSRGLLTNTATGGWRRDLSLLSEQWTDVSASDFSPLNGLPLFTLEPGVQTEARKGGEDPADAGALIYPWAIESSFDTSSVAGANSSKGAASVSWNSIVNFANQYKDIVSGSANGIVVMPGTTNGIDEDVFRRDEIPRQLVLARVHWIFSFFSKEDENDPSKLIPYLKASPVLTFWNPYNVAIERATDNRLIQGNLGTLLPYRFKFSVGGSALSTDFKPLTDFFVGGGRKELWFVVNDDGNRIWKPGESRIYSIRDRGADRLASGKSAQFELGYRTTRGFEWPLTTTGYGRSGDPSTSLSFTVETDRNTEVAFEMKNTNQNTYLRSLSDIDPTILSDYWDDLTITNTNQTLSSVENSPEPFLVAIMQLRTPSDRSTDSMGYAQAKPIISFASNRTTDGAALQNPEAFPLDWVFETPSNSGDVDMLPQFGDANSSLIGTSFRAADGLTRLIVAELPTKPLRSIGELQHFDINANNPRPPYTANPIGNSLASYLVRPNAVAINGAAADSVEVSLD